MEQERGFSWMAAAHLQAQKCLNPDLDEKVFSQEIERKIATYCCKKEKIFKRGHFLEDFLHQNWETMLVYSLNEAPYGKGLKERSQLYAKISGEIFEHLYSSCSTPPEELIHVTCTGYNAPSAAQRLVIKKGWGGKTQVTHAYHMGCLAAIPALRMADGFCKGKKSQVDIVHTELCTLHLNPSLHSAEQLVGQSLFSDGAIKYSLSSKQEEKKGFDLLTTHEEMLSDTQDLMQWECEDWGFKMTLSKEIPFKIAGKVRAFVETLITKANLDLTEISRSVFAIHPGGPKIIDLIQKTLTLEKWQLAASEDILYRYGNMSSATLPHIWQLILSSKDYPKGTLVISLGFGPGLTMGGVILRKYD